jgi:hypothetical protein
MDGVQLTRTQQIKRLAKIGKNLYPNSEFAQSSSRLLNLHGVATANFP